MIGSAPGLWAADDAAAGLAVSIAGPVAAQPLEAQLRSLVEQRVASRIAEGDPTLWGEGAVGEASLRLGWVGLPDSSRPLVEPIGWLRAELLADGLERVVLCGTGGASLAAQVIAAEAGVPLQVLDGSDPARLALAVQQPERTVVVTASKSGLIPAAGDRHRVLETAFGTAFEAAFEAAGIEPASRLIAVTDPGTPLERAATEAGYRAIFSADPRVGGRYGALTAFGLVPAGLAGADIGALLEEAVAVGELLAEDVDVNPALLLGAVLATGRPPGSTGSAGADLVITEVEGTAAGLGAWVAQLIDGFAGVPAIRLLPAGAEPQDDPRPERAEVSVSGTLGAQFLIWEYAVCVAGRLLGINPYHQPEPEPAGRPPQ